MSLSFLRNKIKNITILTSTHVFSPSRPAEGEHEEAWLTEAGLANLFQESVAEDSDASEDSKVMLSTLTRTQAAAVEKRVELLKQTLRKRNKQYHAPDVREIFKPPPTTASTGDDSDRTQQVS